MPEDSFDSGSNWNYWTSFKPAFLAHAPHSAKSLRPTAYLDGLRGLAAFLVYVTHHIGVAHDFGSPIQSGFGADGNYSLLTLPFLRVFFTGSHFAVPIFFVISGFVLARGPLKVIHSQNGNIGASLSSALFRRAIRLWLPVIGTTFTYMIIRHLGVWADWPKLQPTFVAELKAYFTELVRFTYFLRIEENPYVDLSVTTFSYNPHTWTIALEYQGSILLFIVLLSFSTFRVRPRLIMTTLLALYFILLGSWVSFCFLCGSIIAEIELLEWDFARKESQVTTIFSYIMLVLGLWLASMPTVELRAQTVADLARNPGWATLASLVPSTYADIKPYWLSWGAVALVIAVKQIDWLRAFFETRFLQYLGRISFAFYLGMHSQTCPMNGDPDVIVHGPILQVVGVRMYHITGQRTETFGGWLAAYDNWLPLPSIGPFGLELGFLAAQLVILPVTFYCAEIVERVFDAPAVKVSRWCYELFVSRSGATVVHT